MGRILSGTAVSSSARVARSAARVVVAAAVLGVSFHSVQPLVFALEAPSGKSSPATTEPDEKREKNEKNDKAAPATQPATTPSSSEAEKSDKPEARKPGPNGYFVAKGDLTFEVKGDGVFQPAEAFDLRPVFKAYAGPMTITSIAPPGAQMKKGDTLLECDTTYINWNLVAAESDLAAARAGLTKAASDVALGAINDQMGLKAAEDTVKNAEEGKKWWDEVDGPHMLQTADLQVKQSQNTTEDQADELDQLRKMYKDEELTSATADIVVKRAVRGLETLRATLRMQQERRDKVKTFDYRIAKQKVIDGVDGARQGLAMAKAQFAQYAAGRQAALNAAKIGMEQAAKRLADLKEDLNWFSVKAPADGTVAYGTLVEGQWVGGDPRALKPGERITSGQVVMRVYTPGKLKVVLPVPESQSFWLEPGMKAKVTPSAAPHQSFQAKCGPVEVVPRGSPAAVGFQVSIDLGDVDPRLLPGMKASVQIDAGKVEGALLVPVAAVTADKVQVRGEGGKVTERSVKVGKSDGQNVEIRHGLKEGDEVVLPGKK